jgi:hypothetical protein
MTQKRDQLLRTQKDNADQAVTQQVNQTVPKGRARVPVLVPEAGKNRGRKSIVRR